MVVVTGPTVVVAAAVVVGEAPTVVVGPVSELVQAEASTNRLTSMPRIRTTDSLLAGMVADPARDVNRSVRAQSTSPAQAAEWSSVQARDDQHRSALRSAHLESGRGEGLGDRPGAVVRGVLAIGAYPALVTWVVVVSWTVEDIVWRDEHRAVG